MTIMAQARYENLFPKPFLYFPLYRVDGFRNLNLFRADSCALKMIDTPPDTIRMIHLFQTCDRVLIPGVEYISKGPNKAGRTKIIFILPCDRTRCRAASAKDAPNDFLDFFIVLLILSSLFFRRRPREDEIGTNQGRSFKKRIHIHNKIFEDLERRQRLHRNFIIFKILHQFLACQAALSVDLHGIGSADAMAA